MADRGPKRSKPNKTICSAKSLCTESALKNAKAQLRDAVARDQNRAALILWSVSNETPIDPARNAFLKTMAEYARRLDSTRLITSASDKWHFENPQTALLEDPLGEFLDVIGLNEY